MELVLYKETEKLNQPLCIQQSQNILTAYWEMVVQYGSSLLRCAQGAGQDYRLMQYNNSEMHLSEVVLISQYSAGQLADVMYITDGESMSLYVLLYFSYLWISMYEQVRIYHHMLDY